MATYPGGVKVFTTKSDGAGNKVFSAHINDLQDEVSAIEDGLLNATAPINSSHITAPSLQVNGDSTLNVLRVSSLAHAPNQPACRLFSTAVQAQSSNSQVGVTFEGEAFDVGNFHSTAANTDRVTIAAGSSGVYAVHGAVYMLTLNQSAFLHITKNSSIEVSAFNTTPAGANLTFQVSGLLQCQGGDILRLEVQNGSASTISYGSGTTGLGNRLQALKVW